MDKDMISIMVSDWLAENQEASDLHLEGEPYFDDFLQAWVQDATDGFQNYYLIAHDGIIDIY